MDRSIPTVQVVYQLVKDSKNPLTHSEIMTALEGAGRKAAKTIIYPLLEKGYIKRTKKDGNTAFVVTEKEAVFGPGKRGKRRKTALAIQSAVDSPAIDEVLLAKQQELALQQRVNSTFNAIQGLQNTVATIKFATMLEEHGPEQMLLMLSGLEHMRHRK